MTEPAGLNSQPTPPAAPSSVPLWGGGPVHAFFRVLLPLVLLAGCGGVQIPPQFYELAACLAACGDDCVRVEGGYVCRPGPDPCAECPPGWECVDRQCVAPEPPDPEPDPCEACSSEQTCVEGECVDPEPPDPDPLPDWPPRCPNGTPQAAGPTRHGGVDCFDATPRVCGPDWYPVGADGLSCGLEGRRCIPVGCEGADNGLARTYCETELMGGDEPEWHLDRLSGDLRVVDQGWGACVRGSGSGDLWWCFPNGKACSKRVRVNR